MPKVTSIMDGGDDKERLLKEANAKKKAEILAEGEADKDLGHEDHQEVKEETHGPTT